MPPLAHIADGPSGLCYNPGATALPERYTDHFFLCDFRGGGGGSGVCSFAVKPKGAAFEVVDAHEFVWAILATDCDFGPDGGFYVSDWVEGWGLTGKGRIYRFADPEAAKDPASSLVAITGGSSTVGNLPGPLASHVAQQQTMQTSMAGLQTGIQNVMNIGSSLGNSALPTTSLSRPSWMAPGAQQAMHQLQSHAQNVMQAALTQAAQQAPTNPTAHQAQGAAVSASTVAGTADLYSNSSRSNNNNNLPNPPNRISSRDRQLSSLTITTISIIIITITTTMLTQTLR